MTRPKRRYMGDLCEFKFWLMYFITTGSSQQTPHGSPVRAIQGVSLVSLELQTLDTGFRIPGADPIISGSRETHRNGDQCKSLNAILGTTFLRMYWQKHHTQLHATAYVFDLWYISRVQIHQLKMVQTWWNYGSNIQFRCQSQFSLEHIN